jgi:hypothetical protein
MSPVPRAERLERLLKRVLILFASLVMTEPRQTTLQMQARTRLARAIRRELGL